MEIRSTKWWMMVVLATALWSAHFTSIGWRWGSLGAIALYALLTRPVWRWCWEKRILPALVLGPATAFVFIFLVETYLGVSTIKFGRLYPPERAPIGLERPLIQFLSWFYAKPLEWYITGAAVAIGVAGDVIRRLSIPEAVSKTLEYGGSVVVVLQLITFTNLVDLDTPGLNAFAAHYKAAVEKLGFSQAAVLKFERQVKQLTELDEGLRKVPPPKDVDALIEAVDQLRAAEAALGQLAREASSIEEEAPPTGSPSSKQLGPSRDALRDVAPVSRPDLAETVIAKIGKGLRLQAEADAASDKKDQLARQQDQLLENVAIALCSALKQPSEIERCKDITNLVAQGGVGVATEKVRVELAQLRSQIEKQEQTNKSRREEKASYQDRFRAYHVQQKHCFDLATAVADFLSRDPAGRELVAKLNSLSSIPDQLRVPRPELLSAPAWNTGGALRSRVETTIFREVYGSPDLPAAVRAGDARLLSDAFTKAGGDLEKPGYFLFRDWIHDACVKGQSASELLGQLEERARRIP
jgi:hypothetical protein